MARIRSFSRYLVDPPDSSSGVCRVKLRNWEGFGPIVRDHLEKESTDYVWRGQTKTDLVWKLNPRVVRAFIDMSVPQKEWSELIADHTLRFQQAIIGRRGPSPPIKFKIGRPDIRLFALGNHYGLDTQLLDWTESPFVALYFAFVQENHNPDEPRAVFALDRRVVEAKNEELQEDEQLIIAKVPLDENQRLINQCGLFTMCPLQKSVPSWVRTHFRGVDSVTALTILEMPNFDRRNCIKELERMNLTHKTLFPDLAGAAEYCNTMLRLRPP